MSTLIDANTKKLMLAKKQRELSMLFAEQEASKPKVKLRRLKAQGGLTVPLEEPAYEKQPWDYVTNPEFGMPGRYLDGTTYTPKDAFDFGDKLQVYGKEFFDKVGAGLGKVNYGNLGNNLMAISPAISNLIDGMRKEEKINPRDYYNTRRGQVASLMHDRRVNVQPQLNAISDSEKSAQYNVRRTANSRGELMGNMTATSNVAGRNKASVLANKQNQDLGYMGEEAQMLAGLGQQEAQANWNAMDWNMQSLANRRNMWRAGLSQLSQYGQMNKLMKNQRIQDENKNALYDDMFKSITPFMNFMKDFKFSE